MRLFITPTICSDLPAPNVESALAFYGNERILVTSVHGVSHARLGRKKPAERGTFECGHLIARSIGCAFIGQWESDQDDSNHYRSTPIKKAICRLVKERDIGLVIDVHSSHPARPYDIEIGTRSGRSLMEMEGLSAKLKDSFASHHLACAINQIFKAEGVDGGETITEYVSDALKTPAVQLEISAPIVSGDAGIMGYHLQSKVVNAIASAWFDYKDQK